MTSELVPTIRDELLINLMERDAAIWHDRKTIKTGRPGRPRNADDEFSDEREEVA